MKLVLLAAAFFVVKTKDYFKNQFGIELLVVYVSDRGLLSNINRKFVVKFEEEM